MPLFRRRREPRPPPPAWALGLTSDTYGPFIEVVRAELKRHGLNDARIDESEGYVQRGEVQLGLHNLAQQYGQAARRDRGTVVRVHFDQILAASGERDAVAQSWEQARAALKVRLYPAGAGGAIARPLADGIAEVLVLDLPTTVASVNAEDAASWGQDTADLFMSAYENLAGEPPPSLETVDLEDGASLLAYTGDSFFTTS